MLSTAGLRGQAPFVAKWSAPRSASRSVSRRAAHPVKASLVDLAVQGAISFQDAPTEALIAGGAIVLASIAGIAFAAVNANEGGTLWQAGRSGGPAVQPLPREDAVLVFGATGRMGRTVVQTLLAQGRTVVAAARSAERAQEAFGKAGIKEGRQPDGGGILFVESGVDITRPDTLSPLIFAGVSQVVTCVGAVFGRTAEGSMGYLDDMTPERVDAAGVANVAAAAARCMTPAGRTREGAVRMRSAEDLAKWDRLDDVIMGGQSASALVPADDGSGAVWSGELIVEGGGFCGARTKAESLDLSAFDGIHLRVKSDGGQTFKLNIKTTTTEKPEDTYQATFDTLPGGDWTPVFIPWHAFVLVNKNRTVPGGPPIDPAAIRQFGLVYSRFEFNGFPNPRYKPGKFELAIAGGIRAYRDPCPQLVMVSSAGVERNARIGDDEEARKRDIPIVQLNPGAVLNHKYSGEIAVRASGLPYAVLRPTGLVNDSEPGEFLLEASQGDRMTGRLSREELSAVLTAALGSPAAAGKTFELRRSEAADGVGRSMGPRDTLRLFLGLAEDRERTRVGLEPFPAPAPPPKPVTEERKKEILADVRVVKATTAGRGGRVRDEQESAQAASITVTSDGREKIAKAAEEAASAAPAAEQQAAATAGPAAEVKPAAAAPAAASDGGVAPNVAEAREWIAAWKAKQGGRAEEPAGEVDAPANVAEAREWIRRWRAAQLEKKLPEDARL